jgi:hypothetical protein
MTKTKKCDESHLHIKKQDVKMRGIEKNSEKRQSRRLTELLSYITKLNY